MEARRGDPVKKTALAKSPKATLLVPGASAAFILGWLARYPNDTTRRSYADGLTRAARLLGAEGIMDVDWPKMRDVDIAKIRMGFERYSPGTARTTWNAVRSVLRHAWRTGAITGDAFERLIDQPRIPGSRLRRGRSLTPEEIQRVLELVSTPGPVAARAGAILALGAGGGFRRSELVKLRPESVERRDAGVMVRVIGKGNKERCIPIDVAAVPLLDRWLRERGTAPGWLLCALGSRGALVDHQLNVRTIWVILGDICKRAGIPHASPHDLRRTFATQLFRQGRGLRTVQWAMGHARPETTALYDRRSEEEMIEELGAVSVLGAKGDG